MSDDIATAPTRQKGRGAKTETQAAVPANAAPGPFWHAPTVEARNALSTILTAASQQDGWNDDDDSSDAIRMIRVALDVVDERFWIDDALPLRQRQNRVASHAFDVLALITGALNYPGQPFVFERRALLGHASAICTALADMHMDSARGESLVPRLLESIKIPPKARTCDPVSIHAGQVDVGDLSGEMIALNGLLDWTIQARDLCDEIRLSAEIDPDLKAALEKNDIRFRSADWRGLDVGSGVAYVLSRQHALITSIAGASK